MTTTVLAWGAALGVCVGAALFGQTARAAARPSRATARRSRRSSRRRLGLVLSRSGPWLALLAGVIVGALTDAWLPAAALAATGAVAAALVGLALAPR